MSLEGLTLRAGAIGERAVMRALHKIIRDTALPGDVKIEADRDRIILSGRALKRRMIDDARLRNFTR
jgi:hypothetical protein